MHNLVVVSHTVYWRVGRRAHRFGMVTWLTPRNSLLLHIKVAHLI